MTLRKAVIRFDHPLRAWDGFGVNYVETAQTMDYLREPQDYGGFSILSEDSRAAILELIFGKDGLQPGLIKMFLDPWHQPAPDRCAPDESHPQASFDHQTTTHWMRFFAKEGLARTRARGGDLNLITTLYGPPGWMTLQKQHRGRDLDPQYRSACAEYMISWTKYLREVEALPVKYISLHNEGEDYERWDEDGFTTWPGHDYNLYWPPEQVVDFLCFTRSMLDEAGLRDVGFTPGECTNWVRFSEWGYAQAIAENSLALQNLALITSHGFSHLGSGRWFADWRSTGIDQLRQARPELHAWVTSTSWSKMDARFVHEIRSNIYAAKVNGIIPWAVLQRSNLWKQGDPNPGTAFRVAEDGTFTVEPGYHFYKQVCRAGQPGMTVAQVSCNDTEVSVIAFSQSATPHPDAFVIINITEEDKPLQIEITGTQAVRFDAFRTMPGENYQPLEHFEPQDGSFSYCAPAGSVTTFYARNLSAGKSSDFE